jgi:serine/threonine-protein kinase RsbW
MALTPPVTIRVAGTQAGVRDAAAAFDAFCAAQSLANEVSWPVQVALDEILANIVGHAYEGRTDGVIDLRFAATGAAIEVTIWDDGPPWNPLALAEPDTTAPLERRRPGGLGVHLVRRLMQGARYARENGRNRLVLVRSLGSASADGPRED